MVWVETFTTYSQTFPNEHSSTKGSMDVEMQTFHFGSLENISMMFTEDTGRKVCKFGSCGNVQGTFLKSSPEVQQEHSLLVLVGMLENIS